jgi:hypothetical protein
MITLPSAREDRAVLLSDRLRAFDAVCELETDNYETLDVLVREHLEPTHVADLIDRRKLWIKELIYRRTRVGVFNYVSAAVAVLNQVKRGKKSDPKRGVFELFALKHAGDSLFRYVTEKFFQDPVHGTVLVIRNLCTHHRLPGHILTISLPEARGKLLVPTASILSSDEVTEVVSDYVRSFGDELELHPLIREHHDKLQKLRKWVHEHLRELWREEFEYIATHRKKAIEDWMWQFTLELEEALAVNGSRALERYHFAFAGVLNSREQISLLQCESDAGKWVNEAWSVIRFRKT